MNSQSTVRLVIAVLGLLALAVVIGGIILALDDKSLPGELIAIGAAAAGAVGGILSKTGDVNEPQQVHVMDQPVATQEVGAVETGVVVLLFAVAFILGWLAHSAGLFA